MQRMDITRRHALKLLTWSGLVALLNNSSGTILTSGGVFLYSGLASMTYADLLALCPPARYAGNPIISHGGGGWKNWLVMDAKVLVDPTDASKLIMWYTGTNAYGDEAGSVGRADATVANPRSWTEYGSNPILTAGASGQWDDKWIACDTVIYNSATDEFWMYYSAQKTSDSVYRIGLAKSPGSDGTTFTKYAGNPIYTPTAPETSVRNAAVLHDGANWYMYYGWDQGATLTPSIKVATSSDGIAWTYTGTVVWPLGSGGDYDDTYVSRHSVLKLDKYILVAECFDGTRWSIAMGQSSTPTGAVTKTATPIFERSGVGGTFDSDDVATPNIVQIGGAWYLFYQGSQGTNQPWDMGMADF